MPPYRKSAKQTFLKIKNINDENSSCEKLLLVKVDSTLSFSKYSEDITKVACRVQKNLGKNIKNNINIQNSNFPSPRKFPPRKFSPGIFPPISLLVFLH